MCECESICWFGIIPHKQHDILFSCAYDRSRCNLVIIDQRGEVCEGQLKWYCCKLCVCLSQHIWRWAYL